MTKLRTLSNKYFGVNRQTAEAIFQTIILPVITYVIPCWGANVRKTYIRIPKKKGSPKVSMYDLFYEGVFKTTGMHRKSGNKLALHDLG